MFNIYAGYIVVRGGVCIQVIITLKLWQIIIVVLAKISPCMLHDKITGISVYLQSKKSVEYNIMPVTLSYMRNIFNPRLLVLLLTCLACFDVNRVAAQTEQLDTLLVKTSIACDHCLQCSSCSENIEDRIFENNKGIQHIHINPETNTIQVIYKSSKTTPEAIRTAISLAGYDADDVKAVPASYEKLDGCCKAK